MVLVHSWSVALQTMSSPQKILRPCESQDDYGSERQTDEARGQPQENHRVRRAVASVCVVCRNTQPLNPIGSQQHAKHYHPRGHNTGARRQTPDARRHPHPCRSSIGSPRPRPPRSSPRGCPAAATAGLGTDGAGGAHSPPPPSSRSPRRKNFIR
jgi:hypothetical protein